jgi:adenosylcobalamin-dependent ribonucleoside-triphosphate reductase
MNSIDDFKPLVRDLAEGMGQAVGERTILRKKSDNSWEVWGDVANRVALGNALLCPERDDFKAEYKTLRHHISKATLLMSGRHLQHGDETQPEKTEEAFTNCSTSATSFTKFLLLLSGSGVGRCYDDDMMLIDWDNAPNLRCVLSHEHPDFDWSAHESVRDANHKYGPERRNVLWHKVADSREGWAKSLEIWETMAFEKIHKDKTLILDFSDVRCKGSPIGGMQSRPASGPVALINAFTKAASLKGTGLAPWRQALYIDHYFSECVLVGGARRSARMSTKIWTDPSIFDFITVKRPIEFIGKTIEEIIKIRDDHADKKMMPPMGFLWSSNNSVAVDGEFWRLLELRRDHLEYTTDMARHARRVFKLATEAAYADGTGEPGFLNVDKFTKNDEGWDELTKGDYVGSPKYQVDEDTKLLLARLARVARRKKYYMICNPCGEIPLSVLAGFCTIADVVPYHADTLDEAEHAFRAATRALIRVNLMDSIYRKEVDRTNRIGVGMTGVHEFAWKFFRVGFRDLINPDFAGLAALDYGSMDKAAAMIGDCIWGDKLSSRVSANIRAAAFWMTLSRFNRAVREESVTYSEQLGVVAPHTCTTIKPSGSVSKLHGLTEGWHLPALAWMLRWVQFRHDDPLVQQYRDAGYPSRELTQYSGTVIIGFPTAPTIAQLGMGDKLVLAGDATPEEQYNWLMLGEKYWLIGVDQDGEPVGEEYSGQISYTLKFKPEEVDYKHFREMLIKYQSHIKACSVMPQVNNVAYEYLPEEAITKSRYEEVAYAIQKTLREDVGREHLDCATGACPIDIRDGDKAGLG